MVGMLCEHGGHYGCDFGECYRKVNEKANPGLFEDFYDPLLTNLITMNFVDAFYDVVLGTSIHTDRNLGCSLEKGLKTAPNLNLMSNPIYTPPGCSINLVTDNALGTFSY